MPNRHLADIRAGALLLMLAVTACSGPARNMVGTLVYTTPTDRVVVLESPVDRGCHNLGLAGAKAMSNNTLDDIVLYEGVGCRQPAGTQTVYLATTLSNHVTPGYPPWRSFSVVGG
ncbi:hypothetical protein ACFXJ5_08425 [Streptomyces sp. NPDC059373]